MGERMCRWCNRLEVRGLKIQVAVGGVYHYYSHWYQGKYYDHVMTRCGYRIG